MGYLGKEVLVFRFDHIILPPPPIETFHGELYHCEDLVVYWKITVSFRCYMPSTKLDVEFGSGDI